MSGQPQRGSFARPGRRGRSGVGPQDGSVGDGGGSIHRESRFSVAGDAAASGHIVMPVVRTGGDDASEWIIRAAGPLLAGGGSRVDGVDGEGGDDVAGDEVGPGDENALAEGDRSRAGVVETG